MNQSGITIDGKPVLSGVFDLVGTVGLPLDIVICELIDRGAVIDMMDFIRDARRDGWKNRTIISRFCDTPLGNDAEFMARLEKALAA